MNVTPSLPTEILNKIFSDIPYKDQPLLRCCRDWDGYLRGIEQDSIRDLRTLAAETRTRLDPTLFADATSQLEQLSATSDLNLSLLRLRNLRTHLTTSFTAVFSEGAPYIVVELLSGHPHRHLLPHPMNSDINEVIEFNRRLQLQESGNQEVELFKDLHPSYFGMNSIGVLLSTPPRQIENSNAINQYIQYFFESFAFERFTPIFLNSERVNFSRWIEQINDLSISDPGVFVMLSSLSSERLRQVGIDSLGWCHECLDHKKLNELNEELEFLEDEELRELIFNHFWNSFEHKAAFEFLKEQPEELFHTLCKAFPLDPICEPAIQEDEEIEEFMSSKIPVAWRCSHVGVWLECHLLIANDKIEEAIRMSSKLVRRGWGDDMLITIVKRLVEKEAFNRALNLAETKPEITDSAYTEIYRGMLKVGHPRATEIREKIWNEKDKWWFYNRESESRDSIHQQVGLFDYLIGHIKQGRLDVAIDNMGKLHLHMLQSEIHLALATKFAEAHNFTRALEFGNKVRELSKSELENNRSLRHVTLTPHARSQAYFNIYNQLVAAHHPQATLFYSKIATPRVTMLLAESFLVSDVAENERRIPPELELNSIQDPIPQEESFQEEFVPEIPPQTPPPPAKRPFVPPVDEEMDDWMSAWIEHAKKQKKNPG